MPMASYTDCPPTPRATYTEFLPYPSTPKTTWGDKSSPPLTPEANYTDRAPTPTPDCIWGGTSDLLASETEKEGSPKPTSCDSILEGPAERQPNDDCDNLGCDYDHDGQTHGQVEDDDGENQKYHDENDEVIFIGSRPKLSEDPDSPMVSSKTSKLAKWSSTCRESPQTATCLPPAKPGAVTLDGQVTLSRLKRIMSRSTQGKACTWESILQELGVPGFAEVHWTTTQGFTSPSRPSTAHENVSTRARKRKRGATSTAVDTMMSKKKKTRLTRKAATFKAFAVSQPTGFKAKSLPKDWEYKWNKKLKCWSNRSGSLDQPDWCGEEFFLMLADLKVEVRPNVNWLPVSMQWQETGEDGRGVFEGLDRVEDWRFQVSYDDMFEMLCQGVTGHGVVIYAA